MAIRVTHVTFQALLKPLSALDVEATTEVGILQEVVLTSAQGISADNSLAVEHEALVTVQRFGEGSIQIDLTHQADRGERELFIADLEISNSSDNIAALPGAVVQDLEVGNVATSVAISNKTAIQTIELEQGESVSGPAYLFAASVIDLSQERSDARGPIYLDASMSFDVNVSGDARGPWYDSSQLRVHLGSTDDSRGPWYEDPVSELATYEDQFDFDTLEIIQVPTGLQTSVTVTSGSTSWSLSNILATSVRAIGWVVPADSPHETVTQNLELTGTSLQLVFEPVSEQLTLAQSTDAFIGGPEARVQLTVTMTASLSGTAAAEAENKLALQQTAFVRYVSLRSRCWSEIETPPEKGTGFKLQYPPENPTQEITLRSPQFGNLHRLSGDRVHEETRGGTLIVYADPIWPKIETLSFTILVYKETAQLFLEFLHATVGMDIGLIDHENRRWVGVITDPGQVVEDSRGRFTINFVFEGERDV